MSENPTPPENLPVLSTTGRIDQLRRRIDAGDTLDWRPRRGNFAVPYRPVRNPQVRRGLLEYCRMLSRRKWTLVLATLFSGTAGLLFTLSRTPVYHAATTIEVIDGADGNSGSVVPQTNLQTQVDILGSGTLRKRVMHKLASSEAIPAPPADALAGWRALLKLPCASSSSPEDIPEKTSSGMHASASSASRIIRIDVDSCNPIAAADYANTLADEFIEERLESRWEATQRTSEWLTRQLEELKAKLAASEDELANYAEASPQAAAPPGNPAASQDKFRQLQNEAAAAQADRIARQSRYEQVSKGPVDSLPDDLADEQLRASRRKLADAKHDLADAVATYVYSGTPQVQKAQSQVTALENDMNGARNRILERLHSDLVVSQRREQLLTQALAAQSGLISKETSTTARYDILKREVDANREVYESLLQRVKEAGITSAMRSGNFRVVDPAVPPDVPAGPSLPLGTMAGALFGLLAGIGLMVVKAKMNNSVAAPGETPYYLGSPELAVVPADSPGRRGRRRMFANREPLRIFSGSENIVELRVFNQADSPVAESFRVALTSLLFALGRSGTGHAGSPKVVAVSSPGPDEGKTTAACNLAISYAEMNWRVLVIDGDMRRPRLHSIFGVSDDTGLASLLERTQPAVAGDIASAVRQTAIPNLSVMPRGRLRGTIINLLLSPRFAELLHLAREQFDVIVIDTPPLLQLPDARAIAHLTDGVVLVVRSGKTLRETVITARERLRQDRIRVLGSILNDWDPKKTGYYGHSNDEQYRVSRYPNARSGAIELT